MTRKEVLERARLATAIDAGWCDAPPEHLPLVLATNLGLISTAILGWDSRWTPAERTLHALGTALWILDRVAAERVAGKVRMTRKVLRAQLSVVVRPSVRICTVSAEAYLNLAHQHLDLFWRWRTAGRELPVEPLIWLVESLLDLYAALETKGEKP